ncbi:response regulator [Roseovarius aestuariivivens]|uniref:response regulator n=1 Tax=Roseovarius aestuariivivens TaxID=1888910 RepID=UPI00108104A2|nr:response regulator [Roseovarius aestuariivivens]
MIPVSQLDPAGVAPAPPLVQIDSAGTSRGRFDVLILDDDRFEQRRIMRSCSETGLPVQTTLATDLQEFEAALSQQSYDVVLIDYLLPKGDGLAAQRMVQNHPVNFSAAVVMISSAMSTEVAITSMKRGSLDCLDKANLTTEKLRELMIASAKMFAEASRHWIGELLAKQRVQISQDIAKVVRDEMEFGRFIDTIDKRILDVMAAHGLTNVGHWDARSLTDPDEPFHFR